ncbi:hypothetical protein SDC9_38849 [bioreactor metagenome]|uniref:Uncharacterized protein n=1 Tax=bioreactor metagenome TaxID=1076179 RepID=A0A644VN25_9ZZZZ
MKKQIISWLSEIEKRDGRPPEGVIAFNFGLIESNKGYQMYLVGAYEYSEDNDDWACIEPPVKPYRYLRLPEKIQSLPWEYALDFCINTLTEMDEENMFDGTVLKDALAITTGFDDGELIKIR